jgi:hypothetical protein
MASQLHAEIIETMGVVVGCDAIQTEIQAGKPSLQVLGVSMTALFMTSAGWRDATKLYLCEFKHSDKISARNFQSILRIIMVE